MYMGESPRSMAGTARWLEPIGIASFLLSQSDGGKSAVGGAVLTAEVAGLSRIVCRFVARTGQNLY